MRSPAGMLRGPLSYFPAIGTGGGSSFSLDWWVEINESTQWQDAIFFALCAAYALVSAVALVFSSPFYIYPPPICMYVCIEK